MSNWFSSHSIRYSLFLTFFDVDHNGDLSVAASFRPGNSHDWTYSIRNAPYICIVFYQRLPSHYVFSKLTYRKITEHQLLFVPLRTQKTVLLDCSLIYSEIFLPALLYLFTDQNQCTVRLFSETFQIATVRSKLECDTSSPTDLNNN